MVLFKALDIINIDSENPLHLIFNNIGWYIKESNEDKYLIFASTDKNKKVLEKYTKLWDDIKDGEPVKYKKISWKFGLNQMMICLY